MDNESSLSCLLLNLRTEMLKYFPESELSKVFKESSKEKPTYSRVITDSERSWADIIKRKYLSNPQSGTDEQIPIPPQKNRKVIYYGTTSTPNKLKNNTFDDLSENPSTTMTKETLDKQLEQTITKMESMIADSVNTAVCQLDKKLTKQFNTYQTNTNEKIKTIEEKTNDHFTKLNNGFENMACKFDELFTRLTPPPESTASPMEMDDCGKDQ